MYTNDSLEGHPFFELKKSVDRLRGENGCPWDRAQSHDSLKRHLIEEAIEVIAAADRYQKTGNDENLCEELGDLLFLIMLHSKIAQDDGRFCIEDVIRNVDQKMRHRHPKIFSPDSKEDAYKSWNELKSEEQRDCVPLTKSAIVLQKNLVNEVLEKIEAYENMDNWLKTKEIS